MSPGTVGHIPSGWYPDPDPFHAQVGRQRYWDGMAWASAWTERTTTPTVTAHGDELAVIGPHTASHVLPRRTNMAAVVSLIFGILWLFWLGSLVAVVCGHVARAQIKRSGEAGDGAAIAGLILGYLGLAVFVFWMLVVGAGVVGTASVSG